MQCLRRMKNSNLVIDSRVTESAGNEELDECTSLAEFIALIRTIDFHFLPLFSSGISFNGCQLKMKSKTQGSLMTPS